MTKKPRSTIGRAFDVLRVLRGAVNPMSLSAIAEELNVPASSAHAVLMQLLEQQVVAQDGDKRYSLGPSMFYIGSVYARRSAVVRAALRPVRKACCAASLAARTARGSASWAAASARAS